MNIKHQYLLLLLPLFVSCRGSSSPSEESSPSPQTPVTVTHVSYGPLTEYEELNATSAFLQKSLVKASANGYLQTVNVQLGDHVQKGKILFTLLTKEARAIGNTINELDPSFKFSGTTQIRASANGYISHILHQQGDFVQEGESLAQISNAGSLVFLLNLPYELRQSVKPRSSVELLLPDGEKLSGLISSAMPTVDSASQTQQLIIRVNGSQTLPENLIAKVRIIKKELQSAPSLPKEAVLSNETQDEFWVMKLVNDSMAVKVPITKGLELKGRIEILSPTFQPSDRVILTGNYGLPDTARIKIEKAH
ncbi:MAG TPA: HlyD family efflux transporter periplasmic adaptor subunit [Daejeonella sp.]|nr:HlyD family efflux transporter periplasmic adaptor subunit [Daejeonella sp.]